MTRRGAAAAVAVAIATAASAAFAPAATQAVPTVQVQGPAGNPITDAVATFTITTANFVPADFPMRLQLQVSTTPDFTVPLLADTTVDGSSATITVPRLLPARALLYWRAVALTARAGSVPSVTTGPITGPLHLRLVSPNNPAGQSLTTRQPTFTWSASRVPPSLGEWTFELRVEETATGIVRLIGTTNDTVLTLAQDLETNTSYRWRVSARLPALDQTVSVQSAGTFVILSDASPLTTLLHNPFPSPFPAAGVSRVCLWFDLAAGGTVSVSVTDLRGMPVRRIVPGRTTGVPAELPAGRYGRPAPGAASGCDDRFSWDGTDESGRRVPGGVYIVHLRANGREFRRRVVFDPLR